MKVLFIRPNQTGQRAIPIGMSVLQSCLKRANHEVKIFDTTFLSEEVEKSNKRHESLGFFKPTDISSFVRIKKCSIENELSGTFLSFNPDIVAFSLTTNELELTIRLAKAIKKINNAMPVILGGIHPTVSPQETIELECVDMLCIGEGEKALVELLDKMEKDVDIRDIKNIWVKRAGRVFRNDVRTFLDMDTNPPPDCTGFSQMHLYRPFWGRVYRIFDVEVSRGCLYSCSECVNAYLQQLYRNNGKYRREKSLQKAIADLKFIKQRYEPEMLKFTDEILFPWDTEKLDEFARQYKREINLPFLAFGRVEYLTERMVKALKEMGCVSLSIGIESGNEDLRKRILNRNMTNEHIIKAFQICNKLGLRTTGFNLIALPEEGRKEIFDTIKINRKARPGLISAAFVYPFPGTPIRDFCLKKGYIRKDSPIVDYTKDTIIKNSKISKKEQLGLQKTFTLYCLSPKWLYPVIRLCELENPLSYWIYRILIKYFRDIDFRNNDVRFDAIPDIRRLSIFKNPPLGDF